MTPQQVALGFAGSAEREGIRVTAIYRTFLGRDPGPDEVNAWVTNFLNGETNQDVTAGFVGSPEYYYGRGANDPATWVRNAYQDVLHRPATDAEVNYWVLQLG
jgi:hypothetical protein